MLNEDRLLDLEINKRVYSDIITSEWDQVFQTDEEMGHDAMLLTIIGNEIDIIKSHIETYTNRIQYYVYDIQCLDKEKDKEFIDGINAKRDMDKKRVLALKEILKNLLRSLDSMKSDNKI